MIVRGIDATGDWLFGKGLNDYLTGKAALSQEIRTRLMSFLGDCFFDKEAGIDWFNLLGSKNQLSLQLAIRATILNTTYPASAVTGIVETTVSLDSSRELSIAYSVDTTFGNLANTFRYDIAGG